MPRFFVEELNGDRAIITGEDANHIGRSLRMRIGEELTLCCGEEDHLAKITDIKEGLVECRIISSSRTQNEPSVKLALFQALPKSDKMDMIVQKATELGAAEIFPVLTERCVSRPDKAAAEKKVMRWQKIAASAAGQSQRGIIPKIGAVIGFEDCLAKMKEYDTALMCYEKGGEHLSAQMLSGVRTAALLIGSEGGFSEEEARAAEQNGLILLSLGRRILRCETAPIAAISVIMYLTGDLG